MQNFVSDFTLFFNAIVNCLASFYNWFLSNILGEILLFIIIIGIFLYVIRLIINLRK